MQLFCPITVFLLVFIRKKIQDLKAFANILVSTVVTLREHRRWNELEAGSLLFTVVVKKTPKLYLFSGCFVGRQFHLFILFIDLFKHGKIHQEYRPSTRAT